MTKQITFKIPAQPTKKQKERLLQNFTAKLEKAATPALSVPEARIARAQQYAQRSRKNPFVAQIFADIAKFYRERTNNTAALGESGRPQKSQDLVVISRADFLAIVGQYIQDEKLAQSQTNLIKTFFEKELKILQRAPTGTLYRGARKDKAVCAKSDYIFIDYDKKYSLAIETIKLFLKTYPSSNPSTPTV